MRCYLLFWVILGFIIHFYIIFGTNLLTRGPAQNCCFFAYFSVSKKRTIKRSRNGTKSLGEVIFGRKATGWTWTPRQEPREVLTRVGGAPPPRARPLPRGPLEAPPTYFFLLYISTYSQTIKYGATNLIPPPQLYVSTRSHLGACSGAPPEGASITEGFYIITIAPPMKCE